MRKNKKGFTLAELLTVVAILAILAAISIPLISGGIEKAEAETCKTNRHDLMHGTTTASMTDHIDWRDYTSDQKDAILIYLMDQNYLTEMITCPSGGTLYISDITKDTVYFKCTFHDDHIKPGEDGPTDLINQKISDLQAAVEKSMDANGQNPGTSNDSVIRKFVESEWSDQIREVDTSSILTDKVINRIADELVATGVWTDKDKVVKALQNIRDKQVYLVPYYAAKAQKVITYLVEAQQVLEMKPETEGATVKTHLSTNLICYDNHWYLAANHKWDGGLSSGYVLPGFTSATEVEIMNILDNKSGSSTVWVKIN